MFNCQPELFQPYPVVNGNTTRYDELINDVDVVDDVHDEGLSFEKDDTGFVRAEHGSAGVSGQLILIVRFEPQELVRSNGFLALT